MKRVTGSSGMKPIWHLKSPINQHSLDISAIWIPLIIDEMAISKESLQHPRFSLVYTFNPSSSVLTLLNVARGRPHAFFSGSIILQSVFLYLDVRDFVVI
jgi:hypothetical protein